MRNILIIHKSLSLLLHHHLLLLLLLHLWQQSLRLCTSSDFHLLIPSQSIHHAIQQKQLLTAQTLFSSSHSSFLSYPFLQGWVSKTKFLLFNSQDRENVLKQATRVAVLHKPREQLLQGEISDTDCIHVFNICIALLRFGEVTRACIAWSKFWKEDVLMARDLNWLEERLQEIERVQGGNKDKVWRQMLSLDHYVLNYWHEQLKNPSAASEVAAMEANGILFQFDRLWVSRRFDFCKTCHIWVEERTLDMDSFSQMKHICWNK